MANKVISDNPDFMAAWEKKKQESTALHTRAIRKIKSMCNFSESDQ